MTHFISLISLALLLENAMGFWSRSW